MSQWAFLTCTAFCFNDSSKARSQEAALFILTWWEGHWCRWACSIRSAEQRRSPAVCSPWVPFGTEVLRVNSTVKGACAHCISLAVWGSTWSLCLSSNCSFVAALGSETIAGWSSGECGISADAWAMYPQRVPTAKHFFLREQGCLSRSEVVKDLKALRQK